MESPEGIASECFHAFCRQRATLRDSYRTRDLGQNTTATATKWTDQFLAFLKNVNH